ncbi:cyclin-A2-like [Acipenser oxyrinchus oxyrinchus]|uniref:Cyclin-A2 n=1 Tax=Acipenser oxyrinchus oxyrinchus TaxID=40147 RepID=A0AAD8GJL5_ACIOX|nr:cyclin-A2-like [Acipenser oxyrinchus oxyrinchus]
MFGASQVTVTGDNSQNQENVLSRQRVAGKNVLENQENTNPKASNRTVLGVLQNTGNQRITRVQSQRATKQVCTFTAASCSETYGQDPAGKVGAKLPAFTIHVDQPDGACSKRQHASTAKPESKIPLALNPPVKSSLVNRQPLSTIECSMDVSFDSPMVLDMSINEAEENKCLVNEVPDYALDIHKYLREMELKSRPKAGYMSKQPDITNSMRAILVDWLVEVGEEYKLHSETLYLAVNYIDRFLSSMSVLRGKLQLVGTAAMLLASKFEEIYPPEVAEFVYITDDTYTKKQVLRMEHLVLKVLSFDLAAPTINQFLTQYFLHQQVNKKVESLSLFLGELSLVDSDPFLKYLPSVIAAAAMILSNVTITGDTWPESLVELTGYTLETLEPCIRDLYQSYLGAPQHAQQSVREKYKAAQYHGVSLIEPPKKLTLASRLDFLL